MGLTKHLLEKFGSSLLQYQIEVEATSIFSGITFPGRSSTPRIDLLVTNKQIPCAIIMAKWSIRHDRLNDITNECPIYKSAYERVYRGQWKSSLQYYVMTNEFDPARLNKILDDPCIDHVIHGHKAALVNVCKLDGRLEQLVDLADFIKSAFSW